MAEFAARPRGILVAAHHFCHHDTAETLNPVTFVRSIGAQLAAALPKYRAAVDADGRAQRWFNDAAVDPASAFEQAIVGPLNKIEPPAQPLLLVVDALDEALDFDLGTGGGRAPTIVRMLAERAGRLPPWLRVLATSRRRQEVLQPIQCAFRCQVLNAEDARNLEDIRLYVEGRCAEGELARRLTSAGMHGRDIAALLSNPQKSGGKFLYAVRVLNDVKSGALSLACLQNVPPGMGGFYFDAFERRFPSESDYAPVRPLLQVFCAQREPLPRTELAAILCSREEDVGHSLERLEDFLQVRNKRYTFDHISLAQWLVEENEGGFSRARRFAVRTEDGEALIAEWAWRELAAARAHQSEYLARHLGSHLTADERKTHYPVLLLDFCWLEARLRAAGVNALLSDFEQVSVDQNRDLLVPRDALRLSSHALVHDASMLAGQLLGRIPESERALRERLLAWTNTFQKPWLRPLQPSLTQPGGALVRTIEAHDNHIWALRVATSTGRAVTASEDHTLKLWDLATGDIIHTLAGHTGGVLQVSLSGDAKLATSASSDNAVKVWDLERGVELFTVRLDSGWGRVLALSSDGNRAVFGSLGNDRTVRVIDVENGKELRAFVSDASLGNILAVSADGKWAASGTWDGKLTVWNMEIGAPVCALGNHAGAIQALTLTSDEQWIIAGSNYDDSDRNQKIWEVKVWDRERGELLHECSELGVVTALAVSADRARVVIAAERRLKVWNLAQGGTVRTLTGNADLVYAHALTVSPDGKRAISGSFDGTIKIWDLTDRYGTEVSQRHADSVTGLLLTPDGNTVLSRSADGTLILWSAEGRNIRTFGKHNDAISAAAVSRDSNTLVSGSNDHAIKAWDLHTGRELWTCGGFLGTGALAVAADGGVVGAADDPAAAAHGMRPSHLLKLWDLATGRPIRTDGGYVCPAGMFVLTPDGENVVFAAGGMTLEVFKQDDWQPLRTLEGVVEYPSVLQTTCDGRLVVASAGPAPTVWHLEGGGVLSRFTGHETYVHALALTHDSTRAVSACRDGVKVWNLRTGSELVTLEGENQAVAKLAVTPDDRLVIGASSDGTVAVWKLGTGDLLAGFLADSRVRDCAVFNDGVTIVAGCDDGALHFLRIENVDQRNLG